jgi:hypothetical protein
MQSPEPDIMNHLFGFAHWGTETCIAKYFHDTVIKI